MSKVRNDFRVYPFESTYHPDIEMWQVRTGGTDVCITSRNFAEAERVAAALNRDPYYLERGNTQLDRSNMQAPIQAPAR